MPANSNKPTWNVEIDAGDVRWRLCRRGSGLLVAAQRWAPTVLVLAGGPELLASR
jgi:hypothetical protein